MVQNPSAKIVLDVAELVHQRPDFLNLADPGASPFRATLPLSKIAGVRSPVLMAVQESGGLFIVGCPDESGTDAYTTLVADILAASTKMWRMSYEQFSTLFAQSEGATLEELMLDRSSGDWDFDQFHPAVSVNLERGRFPILIVTAQPEGEVKQVLDYLNGMNLTAGLVVYSVWFSGGIVVIEPMPSAGRFSSGSAPVPPSNRVTTAPTEVTIGGEPYPPPQFKEQESDEEKKAQPSTRFGAGAVPTEPAKKTPKPPSPGTKPGVMSGKRPPPKPKNNSGGGR